LIVYIFRSLFRGHLGLLGYRCDPRVGSLFSLICRCQSGDFLLGLARHSGHAKMSTVVI
jgi:hypothetical protein